ncbi:MAG: hypothetical protein HY908_33495 [Myxococcales bacterium]|nr:hypothetical protein [Myxococcales bacterium]
MPTGAATPEPLRDRARACLAALLALGLGCAAGREAPGSTREPVPASGPTAAAPAPTASARAPLARAAAPAGSSCAALGSALAAAEARWADRDARCGRDADCVCYGGPVCPNALVRSCPGAVAAASQAELAPLEAAWQAAGCEGYLWSPYGCEAACLDGRCRSRER